MGHQITFYATPRDTEALETDLRAEEPLIVLHSLSDESTPRVLPSTDHVEDGSRWLYQFLARASDLPAVRLRHVEAQAKWTVDDLRSPVVELNQCFFDGTVLRRGRLYYVDGYYDEDRWIQKPDSFLRWADRLFKRARRCMKKHGGDYIGPDALKWLEAGGRLSAS